MPGFPRSSGLIARKVVLYSVWSGVFKSYIGDVYGATHSPGQGRFVGTDGTKKNFQCAPRHGEVLNSVVWLYETMPDRDETARSILKNYFEWRISSLEEQIDNFKAKIELVG